MVEVALLLKFTEKDPLVTQRVLSRSIVPAPAPRPAAEEVVPVGEAGADETANKRCITLHEPAPLRSLTCSGYRAHWVRSLPCTGPNMALVFRKCNMYYHSSFFLFGGCCFMGNRKGRYRRYREDLDA